MGNCKHGFKYGGRRFVKLPANKEGFNILWGRPMKFRQTCLGGFRALSTKFPLGIIPVLNLAKSSLYYEPIYQSEPHSRVVSPVAKMGLYHCSLPMNPEASSNLPDLSTVDRRCRISSSQCSSSISERDVIFGPKLLARFMVKKWYGYLA